MNIRKNAALLVFLAFVLSACPENDEAKSTEETANSTEETAFDIVLTGSVGDGPVVGSTMRVMTVDGVEIVQLESDSMAVYNVTAQAKGKHYPLTIDSQGGTDLVTNLSPDFALLSAVLEPADATVANVNPFSTFALAIARGLPGGVTKENVESGQTIAVTLLNSGLSSLKLSGPLYTRIDNTNIAEIIKASETLAEIIRRTRNHLNAYGYVSSGDEVVLRLASDLSDSSMNGVGGYATDARTAAIAKIVAAQVLLESASNELHVNGIDATDAMKSAIERVTTTSPQDSIDDLTATSDMLNSVQVGLAAALAVSEAPKLRELEQAVDGLQSDMDYMLVRTLLPSDYRATLDSVIGLVAGGDASVVATVNNINEPNVDEPAVNRAPAIQGVPATSVLVGSPYVFNANVSDPDGDSLTFQIAGLPVWAEFSESTGELAGTPTASDLGTHAGIVISVSDGEFAASLPTFSITVNDVANVNTPPSIQGVPATTVQVGAPYIFGANASDPDGDTLTFAIVGRPVWANFTESTGELSGTPSADHVGTHSNIVITVTDGELSDSLSTFSITVSDVVIPNSPPVISGNPPTNIDADSAYSFTPNASDPNGELLTFSITGLPVWANFTESSGELSGTPSADHVGTHSNIVITVTDGELSDSLSTFSITVSDVVIPNSPPVISGNPPTNINANDTYWFTPNASDQDNDTLTFSVLGLPVWAEFDTSTGNLSGTPGDEHVGVYTDIRITVSDSSVDVNLAPFSITVDAISLGSVTINWTAPTQNEDGSTLEDLDKYRIYWGTSSGNYPKSVTIDAGTTTYIVEGLAAGTYVFVATAINNAGVESAYSGETTKTIL